MKQKIYDELNVMNAFSPLYNYSLNIEMHYYMVLVPLRLCIVRVQLMYDSHWKMMIVTKNKRNQQQ